MRGSLFFACPSLPGGVTDDYYVPRWSIPSLWSCDSGSRSTMLSSRLDTKNDMVPRSFEFPDHGPWIVPIVPPEHYITARPFTLVDFSQSSGPGILLVWNISWAL